VSIQHFITLFSLALGLLIAAGCGDGLPPPVPVRGQVTFDGRPLSRGAVVFHGADGSSTAAMIGSDGRYEVRTHRGAGLPPGHYRVSISPQQAGDDPAERVLYEVEPTQAQPVEVPARFLSPETSGVTMEVREGMEEYDLELSTDSPTPR